MGLHWWGQSQNFWFLNYRAQLKMTVHCSSKLSLSVSLSLYIYIYIYYVVFTLYLEYFNIFFFSYLFIFISPPFPFLLLLLSPHSHNHLLFVASIRPRWSCQSRLSAANLACPAAVLVAHPYHRPISPLIFGENFDTFDWILGCEWRVWFFFCLLIWGFCVLNSIGFWEIWWILSFENLSFL